jgi:hypothetical protein
MSLIQSAEISGVERLENLVELLKHAEEVERAPAIGCHGPTRRQQHWAYPPPKSGGFG